MQFKPMLLKGQVYFKNILTIFHSFVTVIYHIIHSVMTGLLFLNDISNVKSKILKINFLFPGMHPFCINTLCY